MAFTRDLDALLESVFTLKSSGRAYPALFNAANAVLRSRSEQVSVVKSLVEAGAVAEQNAHDLGLKLNAALEERDKARAKAEKFEKIVKAAQAFKEVYYVDEGAFDSARDALFKQLEELDPPAVQHIKRLKEMQAVYDMGDTSYNMHAEDYAAVAWALEQLEKPSGK